MTGTTEADADAIRHGFQRGFDRLNERLSATGVSPHLRFLNFGFRPLEGEQPAGPPLPRRLPNRDSAQLCLEVVQGVDLQGARVVEVGCGRGGNLWLAREALGATSVVGVDLSAPALQFCRTAPSEVPAGFVQGDAQAVPLADGCADVLLNVESSCCYPDVEAFYREVARLLRVGGTFAYADLLPTASLAACEQALTALGLEVLRQRDITANVAASRAAEGARQARLLERSDAAPTPDEWVGEAGSNLHDHLTSGEAHYVAWQLRKVATMADPAERLLSDEHRARLHANARFTLAVLDPAALREP
jgi:SAM-dependent methyltransferase